MRAGKVLLLVVVLTVGAGLQTAVAVRDHISLGARGCHVFGRRFEGPSFAFESRAALDLPTAASLRVENAFGRVKVRAGVPGKAEVVLGKVVFLAQRERALELADKLQLLAQVEGNELRVRTNRQDFEHGPFQNVGIETNLEIVVPPGTAVHVSNEHGAVEVADAARLDLTSSFDDVRVERVVGDALVKVQHGNVELIAVGGALSVEARHGGVQVREAVGALKLDLEHGDADVQGSAGVEARLRHGNLKAEHVAGGLNVRGEHAGVEAQGVAGAVDVETAYRDVSLREVTGDVRVVSQHGELLAHGVQGSVHAELQFGSAKLERVRGLADVQVEHGGVIARSLASGARVRASGEGVEIEDFSGPLQVSARRADVELTPAGALVDALEVDVEHGGVTLIVPSGSRGQFDAQAERGEISVRDVPQLHVTTENPERATGQLGEGGPVVRLRTRHGDIALEGRAVLASEDGTPE